MLFVRGLKIASQTGPAVFENCMAGFQRDTFIEMAPSLEALRVGEKPKMQRFWIERTKKASKDADLAVIMMWLVAFPVRPLYMQVGAADRVQAGIVKDRMSHLLHHNPWLNDYVEMVQNEVRSKALMASGDPLARIEIKSSDVAGSHGGTPDLLVINELSHISKWEFAENMMSNASGVAQGIVIVATNAGIKGSKAEVWRINALKNPDQWSVWILSEPAPWHSLHAVQDEKRRMPIGKWNRLWGGKWESGKGDALGEDMIQAAFCLPGPIAKREAGWTYFLGIDLGITHDHAGLAVLGANINLQKIKLVWMCGFEPTLKVEDHYEVNLDLIEKKCLELHKFFNLFKVGYDPYQAILMAQRLRQQHLPMKEVQFTSSNLSKMADSLLQVMNEKKLQLFDDEEGRLRRDFGKFNIVEKTYGYRLEATSDEFGHADVGTAVVLLLPMILDFLAGVENALGPDEELVGDLDIELSPEEVADMPAELRELYEEKADTEPRRSENSIHKVVPRESIQAKPIKIPAKEKDENYDPFYDID